jgi:hypothetical protein
MPPVLVHGDCKDSGPDLYGVHVHLITEAVRTPFPLTSTTWAMTCRARCWSLLMASRLGSVG